ncbi:hypothetical protein L6164_034865 [Bauhinia variegata]|uniref:Uncharacterized protein n=1 Tax=Bauhinia variegata TaxID=167791 RepID=A0ACB9KXI8_BAUVA|nr:hypothetical protein L6164_034865 [Bauhinia variegata]
MGVEAHQSWHDKPTSDCRSFGSNIHPSSQSRKISIGVLVDSAANTRYGATKQDQVIMPNTERVTSKTGTFSGEKSKIKGLTAPFNKKQTGGPEEVKCSRIARSLYQRASTSETIRANLMEKSNLLVSSGRQDKPDEVESAPAKYSVQQCSKHTSVFNSGDSNQKLDGFPSKGEEMKDATERVEEFTFETAQEVIESDKAKREGKINNKENRTENLRTKLCEILGTTASPRIQCSGSQICNMDKESLLPEQRLEKSDRFVKARQNSDTIETDSENPDHTNKRPITRSLSRKRASTKIRPTKRKRDPPSREKYQEKNTFHFEERWTAMESVFRDGGSSMYLRKKSNRESSRTGPLKICSPENDGGDKFCQENSKTDIRRHNGETFSLGNEMAGFQGCLSDHQKKFPQTVLFDQEKEFCQSPIISKTDQNGEREGSANGKQEEDRDTPVVEHASDRQDNLQSPSFRLTKPTLGSTSPGTPKTDQMVNAVSSPASSEKRFSLGAIRNLRTFQNMEPDCDRSRAPRLSSDMEELKDSLPIKSASFVKENEDEDGLSDSLSEEKKSAESQEVRVGPRERGSAEKQTSILYPIKRLRSHEGIKFSDNGPASPSSKGIGENNWIHEASEQNPKDGFSRAIELFALELGRLKNKLKSVTNQKTTEIFLCVVEETNAQLQNVHSQIQTDIGKLMSHSKSKRKRLETSFEDHQRQLRLIHDKFKEEVSLHLQDCRSTLEGLEADQIEIKGALEKQRVSHRKLISQVEAAVETQLNDSQRKITAIQESARGKLLQLKQVMAMCMKEGILN